MLNFTQALHILVVAPAPLACIAAEHKFKHRQSSPSFVPSLLGTQIREL